MRQSKLGRTAKSLTGSERVPAGRRHGLSPSLRAGNLEQNRPGERLQGRHAAGLRCRPRPAVHRQGAHRREGERPLTKWLTCWVLGGRVGVGNYCVYSILQSLQELHTFTTL